MKTYLALAFLFLTVENVWSDSRSEKDEYLLSGTGYYYSRSELEKNLIAGMNALDVQYNCRAVKITYHTDQERVVKYCKASYSCAPRTLKQKQILSLQRACEKEAREECFQSEFLDYLDDFENTKFTYTNKPRCGWNL